MYCCTAALTLHLPAESALLSQRSQQSVCPCCPAAGSSPAPCGTSRQQLHHGASALISKVAGSSTPCTQCRDVPDMMHWSRGAVVRADHVARLKHATVTGPRRAAPLRRGAGDPGLTRGVLVQAAGARAGWAHAVKPEDPKYGSVHGMHSEVRGYQGSPMHPLPCELQGVGLGLPACWWRDGPCVQ